MDASQETCQRHINSIESSGKKIPWLMKSIYLFFALFCASVTFSQPIVDTVYVLDEVRISDRVYKRYNQAQTTLELPQQNLVHYRSSLAGSIASQSLIHIKENGLGGVSSPSFRGTTAQHTALVWNGLQINSSFNGQADFSLLSPWDYSQVEIKAGGGSVLYGSGAIGGSIHLNQSLQFDSDFRHQLRLSGGEFGQQSYAYRMQKGSSRWAIETGISYLKEENDFKRLDNGRINENSQHQHYQFNLASAYALTDSNWLRAYFTWNESDRNFALMTPTDTPTGMDNRELRALLEWQFQNSAWLSKLRTGYLHEDYDYFENILNPSTDFGTSNTLLAQYQLERKFNSKTRVQGQLNGSTIWGQGSMLADATQQNLHGSFQLSHEFEIPLLLEMGIRQDWYSDYSSPFLYSAGVTYSIIPDLRARWTASKNYRVPTLNDLYWRTGGDVGINPETSLQWEAGLDYRIANVKLAATYYRNQIEDMIQWQPGQSSQWQVENVNKVAIQGVEFSANYRYQLNEWTLNYTGQLGYTESINEATQKQLIYVPKWKNVHRLDLAYTRWQAHFNALNLSQQFVRSDNNPLYVLDAYTVLDAGLSYTQPGKYPFTLGVQLRNLTDQLYYGMERRPYPGRHLNLQLQIEL